MNVGRLRVLPFGQAGLAGNEVCGLDLCYLKRPAWESVSFTI